MKQRSSLFTILFITIFLISENLFSDTIQLKSGKSITGEVVNQTPTEVHIDVDGKTQKILKRDIRRIQYTDPEVERRRIEEAKKQEAERLRLAEEAERLKRAEEARRAEELEKERRADEQRRLEEAKKQEEERVRLVEEERERVAEERERTEKEKIRSEKGAKAALLAKRHHITVGLGYGPSGEKTYAENYLSGFSKLRDRFSEKGQQTVSTDFSKKANSSALNLRYALNRYYLFSSFSSNRLKATNEMAHSGNEGNKGSPDRLFFTWVKHAYDPTIDEALHARLGWIFFLRERFEADLFFGLERVKITAPLLGAGLRKSFEVNTSGIPVRTNFLVAETGESEMSLKGPTAGISLLYRMASLPIDFRLTLGKHTKKGDLVAAQNIWYLTNGSIRGELYHFTSPLTSSGTSAALETTYKLPGGLSAVISLFHERQDIEAKSFGVTVDGIGLFLYNGQPILKHETSIGPDVALFLKMLEPQLLKDIKGSEISWGMRVGIEKRFEL
jgi:hypothetical protein